MKSHNPFPKPLQQSSYIFVFTIFEKEKKVLIELKSR